MTKVGIIGAGKIAERHISGYKKLGVDIVISDIDEGIADRIGSENNIDVVKDLEAILTNDLGIEIIDVCTPVTTHKDIILHALKENKHVFCEKPLCLNLREAYQIKGAAENAEKFLMVGYLYRFHPAFQKVKQWLDEGIIGKPYFAIFRIGGRGSHRPWKHFKKDGGGAINEMLSHKLDLVMWFLGETDYVKTYINETVLSERIIDGKTLKADAEDIVLIELQSNGVRVICQGDFITPSYMEYIELHGENGSIFTSILNFFPTILFLKRPRAIFNQGNNFFTFEQINLFELELGYFLDCINNNTRNLNSVDDSIKVLEVIEKIERI
jgi:predicted dehydrogenase